MPGTLPPQVPNSEETLAAKLETLVKKFDPKGTVKEKAGYYFCFSQQFKGSRTLNTSFNKYDGKELDTVKKGILEYLEKRRQDAKSEVLKEMFRILTSEYKIHLMPKPKYIRDVVKILLEACKNDPELAASITTFKVKRTPISENDGKPNSEIMPQIVIYPALGKEHAERVLNKVFALFSKYSAKVGLGLRPRFNKKIDGLIYYAQGGGDFKKALIKKGLSDDLSEEQGHFNFENQHLNNPILEHNFSTLKVCLDKMRNVEFYPFFIDTVEINKGTSTVPDKHIRVWIKNDPDPDNMREVSAFKKTLDQFNISYQDYSKDKRDFIAIRPPSNSSLNLEKMMEAFEKGFIEEMVYKDFPKSKLRY